MPPAPPISSTITWRPRASDRGGEKIRATTSTELPAAPGATIVRARAGHVSARAGKANSNGASVPRMPIEVATDVIATAGISLRKPVIAVPPMETATGTLDGRQFMCPIHLLFNLLLHI